MNALDRLRQIARPDVKLPPHNAGKSKYQTILADAKRRGLSQTELARELGVGPHTISRACSYCGINLRDGRSKFDRP